MPYTGLGGGTGIAGAGPGGSSGGGGWGGPGTGTSLMGGLVGAVKGGWNAGVNTGRTVPGLGITEQERRRLLAAQQAAQTQAANQQGLNASGIMPKDAGMLNMPVIGGDKGLAPSAPTMPAFTAPGPGQGGGASPGGWGGPGTGATAASGAWGAIQGGMYGPAGSSGAGVPGYPTSPQYQTQTTPQDTTTAAEDPYAAYRQFLPPASSYNPGGVFYTPDQYINFDIATDPAYQNRFIAPKAPPDYTAAINQTMPVIGGNTGQTPGYQPQNVQYPTVAKQAQTDATGKQVAAGMPTIGGNAGLSPGYQTATDQQATPDMGFPWAPVISGATSLISGLIGSQGAGNAADAELAYLREARQQNLAGGLSAGDLQAQAQALAANELYGAAGQSGQTMANAYGSTGQLQSQAAQDAANTMVNAYTQGGQYRTDAAGRLYNAAVGTGQTGVNIQEQKLQQALQGLSPYTQAGQMAVGRQTAETLAGPGPYQLSDEYKFQLQQGLEAQNRALAAQGMLNSGRAVKEAGTYAQGVASSAEQQAYNNWLSRQQALGNLSQMGLSGATTGGNLSVGTGAGQANTLLSAQQLAQQAGLYGAEAGGTAFEQAGGAQAQGYTNVANALSTGIMGQAGSLADMYSNQANALASGYTGASDARANAIMAALGMNVPLAQQQGLAAGDQYINQANVWNDVLGNASDLAWLFGGNSGLPNYSL